MWLLAAVKALSPQGTNNWLRSLWRSLRQRADGFFCAQKWNAVSWVTLAVFVDDIHNISRGLNINSAFGLNVEVVWSQLVLLSNYCSALPVMSAFFSPVSSSLVLGLGDAEEPDISRNLLSLAEVLLMSAIDKWESKHVADQAGYFQRLTPSLISCHSTHGPPKKSFSASNTFQILFWMYGFGYKSSTSWSFFNAESSSSCLQISVTLERSFSCLVRITCDLSVPTVLTFNEYGKGVFTCPTGFFLLADCEMFELNSSNTTRRLKKGSL